MNERIKQLAEQAAHDTRVTHNNAYWRMQDEIAEDATWREKFAELIVRECLTIVERKEYSYHEADPLWETAQLIKQHFGVE
jgi:hypothetical protein